MSSQIPVASKNPKIHLPFSFWLQVALKFRSSIFYTFIALTEVCVFMVLTSFLDRSLFNEFSNKSEFSHHV